MRDEAPSYDEVRWDEETQSEVEISPAPSATPAPSAESGLAQSLQKNLEKKQRELAAAPTRESIEADVRAQWAREKSIEAHLQGLGHPAGLRELVEDKLGSAEATPQAITQIMAGLGYKDGKAPASASARPPQANLQAVTGMSAEMQSAIKTAPSSLARRIAETQTPQELEALMASQNLLDRNN